MQMENVGVRFDYKLERRCILLYYTVKVVAAILLNITTAIIYAYIRNSSSPLTLMSYIGPHTMEYFTMSNISTAYLSLLRCLRQRFMALNSLLRWFSFYLGIKLFFDWWMFFFSNEKGTISTQKFVAWAIQQEWVD